MKDHTATLASLFIGAAAVGIPLGRRAARWYRGEPVEPYSQADAITTSLTNLVARKAN